ncbi:creatininase family protein [Saccharothrix variisporea]|uniref:Creatinine amidohydrolase n=1 Tax=Saccharothrix variisporea TaxID=543527 RepID=A0A495X9A1_9PSEU|nr:creatininase family protein [Saccharothrix variisporea]RKT68118.1 creatinine amidohydrolase [Saccharothrix variisporea]
MITLATTEDVRERGAAVAVLPVGSFEQHGPHLPLATDTIIACTIAQAIADAYPVRLLPPITISCSHEHAAWPGTVSISARTLYSVITDIAESLHGIPLVVVNAHGGNYVLSNVVQESPRMALYPTSADWAEARAAAGIETPSTTDMHAGEIETSILLHAHPEVVRPGYETADHVADDRRHLLTTGLAPYTASGVVGRPSRASADKGRDLLAALVTGFGRHLATL